MKNIALLVIITLSFSFTSTIKAQTAFQLGLNSCNYTNGNYNRILRMNMGVSHAFGKNVIQFIPGIFYSQKGTQVNFLGETSKISIGYLDIPLDLSIGLKIGDSNRLFLSLVLM